MAPIHPPSPQSPPCRQSFAFPWALGNKIIHPPIVTHPCIIRNISTQIPRHSPITTLALLPRIQHENPQLRGIRPHRWREVGVKRPLQPPELRDTTGRFFFALADVPAACGQFAVGYEGSEDVDARIRAVKNFEEGEFGGVGPCPDGLGEVGGEGGVVLGFPFEAGFGVSG